MFKCSRQPYIVQHCGYLYCVLLMDVWMYGCMDGQLNEWTIGNMLKWTDKIYDG